MQMCIKVNMFLYADDRVSLYLSVSPDATFTAFFSFFFFSFRLFSLATGSARGLCPGRCCVYVLLCKTGEMLPRSL